MSPLQVKPYVEGQTGSLSDVIERGPELAPITPAGPGGFAPDPTWSQMFTAALPAARRSSVIPNDTPLLNAYTPIVDALGLPPSENPARFYDADPNTLAVTGALGQPSSLATAAQQGESAPFGGQRLASRQLQESLIVDQIKARRAKDPNWGPGIPDTIEGIHAFADQQEAKARAAGAAVLARGSTFGRVTAGLAAGGAESALHDPSFLPSMVLGGGTATSVLQAVGRDALINGVFATVYAPTDIYRSVVEDHEPLTAALGEAATNIVSAATIGAAAGTTVHLAVAHVPPALFKVMPESVQTRWADRMRVGEGKAAPLLKDVLGDMDNRELSTFARSTIGPRMTPDEKAAANVLERSQDLGEASPFEPGPEGDAAHNANLATSLKTIIDGAPNESPKADLLTSTSPLGLRPPRPIAAPVDAGFDAQWHAIVGNEGGTGPHGEFLTSPKGAIGPAQVMPGTAPYAAKLAGLPWDEAKYRGDPAYNQAIGRAYYAEQLRTFGDPDMAAAAYNAGPGSAARGTGLRGAIKRAAEHGEPGNWEAYLPRETQAYVENFRKRAGGAVAGEPAIPAGGEDGLAALQRSADEAEAQAIELGRGREQADFTTGDRADVADVPLLKRELFGSDEQWADAQAGFHQSLNGPEEAAGAPLSAATPSGPPMIAQADATGARGGPGEFPNTRGAGSQYHGARGEVPQLSEGYYNPDNIYGGQDTFYTTDALDVAAGYGRRRTNARVYSVSEREPVNFFDMEEDLPVARIEQLFGGDDLAGFAVEEAQRGGKAKLREVMDEMRSLSAGEGLTKNDVQEIFDTAIVNLSREGYGGMTHIGGLKTGREPHAVKIYFDAPNQLDLADLGSPKSIVADVADVRIDEPALKAFDDGANGRVDQLASLEHDAHVDVEQRNREVAAAVLDRLTASGRLPRAPTSLIEFLAKRGGINDVGGDLRSMGLAPMRGIARRGERKLINPRGVGIDEALSAAIEAGYFPEFNALRESGSKITYAQLPDTQILRDAIDEELRGRPLYADVEQGALFERARHADNEAWLSEHVDSLQSLADTWGLALDEGTLDHALTDVGRGTAPDEALSNAVTAAAMRDLGAAVADTGELRYGIDNEGRPWDDEVNYAEHTEAAADGGTPGPGERRPAAHAANATPGGAVAGQHESPAGAPSELGARRYQLDESSNPKTLAEILDEIDRDKAAVAALRACAEGGGQ